MKKMLFVINPYAGTRKAGRILPEIISLFNRAGYQVTVHITAGQDDAARAVEQLAAGMDLVVCCGGDGTFNETVTGLLDSGVDVPVGYIPAGSTNDFAASLNISGNPLQAARDILEGTEIRYDVGRFGDRYFTYVASFGAFTRASYATPQSVKNALGNFVDAIAVMLITTCIIPIVVLIVILWIVKLLFGVSVNTSAMKRLLAMKAL